MSESVNVKECIENKLMSHVQLTEYKSHKTVHALDMTGEVFKKVRSETSGGHAASGHGFLVVYDLGTEYEYVSWCPRGKFLRGNSRAEKEGCTNEALIENVAAELKDFDLPAIRIIERVPSGAEVEMEFATIEAYEAYVRINDLQEQEVPIPSEPSAEEATAKKQAFRPWYTEENEAARLRLAKERENQKTQPPEEECESVEKAKGQTFRQAIKSFELDQRRAAEDWLNKAMRHYMEDAKPKS